MVTDPVSQSSSPAASVVVSCTPTSSVVTAHIPGGTTLTSGSLAQAVAPVRSEIEPKPNAKRKSMREPKEKILAALDEEVRVHPRPLLTTRVRKGWPKAVYKRAAKSSPQAESGTL